MRPPARASPRPGQLYADVLTPGWVIEVRVGGRTLDYHTDRGSEFALCAER